MNYYAVPRNFQAAATFRKEVIKLWRRGLSRRSQKAYVTWPRMLRIADARLRRVRIVYPWPSQRLAPLRQEPSAGNPLAGICAGGRPEPGVPTANPGVVRFSVTISVQFHP